VPDGSTARLGIVPDTSDGSSLTPDAGDTVTVNVGSDFETVVPGLLNGLIPGSMNINSSATMRFELDLF